MQKSLRFIACLAVLLFAAFALQAQAPHKFSYQAVVRNATNELVRNATVGVRISIFQYTAGGTLKFQETHAPTTNDNGLFTIEIGGGTLVSGAINTIDWADGPYFLRSEVDPLGGTTYSLTADQQLLAVPYALHCDEYQSLADVVAKGNHAGMEQLKDVKDPTQPQDAVTKHYLDSVVALVSALAGARVKDTAATACASFTWPRTGETYTTSGLYFDTLKNACGVGCDTVVSLRLTIVDGPAVTLGAIGSSLGTTTCAGQPAVLSANVASHTGTLSYVWTKSAGAALISDNAMVVSTNNLTAGDNTYSVTVTATVAGCGSTNASEDITIAASTSSAVTLNAIASSNGTTICADGSTTLTASAATSSGTLTYVWSASPAATAGMSATTGASITVEPTAVASHTYTVTATAHQDGCVDATDTKDITIGVDAAPALSSVTISSEGDETEFCEGESNTLTANTTGLVGTPSYQWKKNGSVIVGATNTTYEVSEAGSYTVTVTASNGVCDAVVLTSSAKVMTVASAPTYDVDIYYDINDLERYGNDAAVSVAIGDNVQLQASDAGDADSYAWTLAEDAGFSSSNANVDISTTTPGTYHYTLTAVSQPNLAGCQKTVVKTIEVTVADPCDALGTPVITGSTSICPDSYSTLSVTSPVAGATYHWFKGSDEVATGTSYDATTAGTYKVRATKDECTSDYSNTITTSVVSYNPTLSFTGTPYSGNTNTNIPVQVSVGTLDGGTNGGYTWSIVDASTTAAGASQSAGTYSYSRNISATGAGTVRVRCVLTVNKSGCSKNVTAEADVTVNSCSITISSLSWTRQGSGLPNAPIALLASYSATGYTSLSWSWSRYNGAGANPIVQTPSYIIENTQNSKNAFILSSNTSTQYWGVTLTASNATCSVSKTYIGPIVMSSNYTSSGSFTLTASKSGTKGLNITGSGSVSANSYMCVSVVPLSNTECVDGTNPCYFKSSSSKTSWSASYSFGTTPASGTTVRVYAWLSSSTSCTMGSYGKSSVMSTTVSY